MGLLRHKHNLIAGLLILATLLAVGGYACGVSGRRAQARTLATELVAWEGRPTTDVLRDEADRKKSRLADVRPVDTASSLRRVSEVLQDAGLSGRSVATRDPYLLDGLVQTEAKFTFHGSLSAMCEALQSPAFRRPGVLVQRVRVGAAGTVEDTGLMFEMDLVLARPE